jgi:stress response protein YsnF
VSRQEQESVPVVEEQVSIGKRKVLRGGVRLTSTVSERPVEETIRLREENVEVEQQRADRKLSPEEAEKAFQQKTIELTETAEEAVISKEARVVGEVSLEKTVAEREETVQATARRTDVKVENIDPNERRKS